MEVCIIGGGISGVISAKLSIDHGLVPFILCKSPAAGGLWNGFPNEIGVWNSMSTNTSKWLSTFTDHLWSPDHPEYPSTHQVLDYLSSYIEKHSLHQYFHFNSTVTQVSRQGEDYLVRWRFGEEVQEKVFKYLIIASGRFSKEHNPIKNPEQFSGTIVRGSEYREPSVFSGKKVLCVGRSFTGSDISLEALSTAESVTQIYTGKPYVIMRRHFRTVPADFLPNLQMALGAPSPLIQTLQSNTAGAKRLMSIFGNPGRVTPEWEIPESPTEFCKTILLRDDYLDAISDKRIGLVKGRAQEFYSNGIVLADGRQIEADVVLLCTGYSTDYSYLSDEIKEIVQYREDDTFVPVTLYRSILHPSLPRLCFTGIYLGPHSGRYELPVEIGIRQMLGKLSLTEEELWQGVRDEEFIRENLSGLYLPYNFPDYLKEMMRILGIKLDKEFIKNELEFSNGPVLPQMFWLERPGQIELAKQAIAEIKARYPQYQFN